MDAEKRVPIKLRPVLRKHKGKITEPYDILDTLLNDCEEFEPILDAHIRLYWRKDWQADVDGVVIGAQSAKATDLERLLAEEAGERVDLVIMLPEQTWPKLDATEKEHRLYHELCHFAPALDSNGEQKQDEKDRPLWRLKRHPIVAFPGEVKRYGADRVLGHNEIMLDAAEASDMPLFNGNGNGNPGYPKDAVEWRFLSVDGNLDIPAGTLKALHRKGINTLQELSELMNRHPQAWHTHVPGVGAAAAAKVADAYQAFWAAHPEYAEAG